MKRIVMVGTGLETQGGVSAVVNCLRDAGLLTRCNIKYITSHIDGGTFVKLAVFFRGLFVYFGMLLTGRVALLHVHMASRLSFWRKLFFILLAHIFRIPVVVHLHGAEFHIFFERECSSLGKRLISIVFEHSTRVIVLSQSWKEWVHCRFPKANVQLIYNPVTLPTMTTVPREAATVLFLGRLGVRKGAYHLIKAVSRILKDFPDLKLLLGGDGEVEKARNQAHDFGIESRVELMGWVTGAEKGKRLLQASVFVLPSYNEGMPMALLEAMSYGLPVISTPVGGIPEAVTDGVEGFLVPPGDEAVLADRLRQLLRDDGLRKKMGEAARDKVERCFSTEAVVPQFEMLYAELVENKQGGHA